MRTLANTIHWKSPYRQNKIIEEDDAKGDVTQRLRATADGNVLPACLENDIDGTGKVDVQTQDGHFQTHAEARGSLVARQHTEQTAAQILQEGCQGAKIDDGERSAGGYLNKLERTLQELG